MNVKHECHLKRHQGTLENICDLAILNRFDMLSLGGAKVRAASCPYRSSIKTTLALTTKRELIGC